MRANRGQNGRWVSGAGKRRKLSKYKTELGANRGEVEGGIGGLAGKKMDRDAPQGELGGRLGRGRGRGVRVQAQKPAARGRRQALRGTRFCPASSSNSIAKTRVFCVRGPPQAVCLHASPMQMSGMRPHTCFVCDEPATPASLGVLCL